jgi:hypothetical protein
MKATNYWTFEILPSGNYLNSFTRKPGNFSIGEDYTAMPLNFLLNSVHFAKKENPEDVYTIASFICAMLTGFTTLINVDPKEHYSARLGDLFKNGEKVYDNYKCEVDLLKIDVHLDERADSNEFINQSFHDGFIRNILLYCNDGWTLVNMYKISDEVSLYLKEREDDISNYVNKPDYSAFGATANNFSVSGLQARHGKSKNLAPKRTMTIEEASTYIRKLLKIILEKYFGFKLEYIEKNNEDFDFETIEF